LWGSFFDAILVRCTVFVSILVGLLSGGKMGRGKVEAIEEPDLMKWTMDQGIIAGKALLFMTRKRKTGEAVVDAWKR